MALGISLSDNSVLNDLKDKFNLFKNKMSSKAKAFIDDAKQGLKSDNIEENILSDKPTYFEERVYEFLDTVSTEPLVHWGLIAGSGVGLGSRRFNMFTAVDYVEGQIPGASAIKNNKVTELLNYVMKITMDPNIEGIPIGTSQITVTRDIDISESTFIVPEMRTKEYRADNSVPHLREWTISGYISSIASFVDYGLVIKPTILIQMKLLDTFAKSRRPVWFKTNNGTFHRVQIKRIQMSQDPTMMNGVKIDLVLKEYYPIVIKASLKSSSTAVEVTSDEALITTDIYAGARDGLITP